MEVLETITDERSLLALLRFFLRSRVPQIASKTVLILGRRCNRPDWMRHVMTEGDDRIRANLIESLWRRREPEEIRTILEEAVKDQHHRVVANAVYGLFLGGYEGYQSGIDQLIANRDPIFRQAAIWVIGSIGAAEVTPQLKRLLTDPDSGVRRKAFAAMKTLQARNQGGTQAAGRVTVPTVAPEAVVDTPQNNRVAPVDPPVIPDKQPLVEDKLDSGAMPGANEYRSDRLASPLYPR
jgi:hypothetical protein